MYESCCAKNMDACKPFSIRIDKNIVNEKISPTKEKQPADCNTPDDSDEEDDDLPPNPFSSPIRPVVKRPLVTPPRESLGIKSDSPLILSPNVAVNNDTERREKLRKHQLVKNIVKRNLYSGSASDAKLEEHFKQGGIMAKMAKREAKEEDEAAREQVLPDEDQQDYNKPPGLSVFVSPIKFVAEIEAPSNINSSDPFEADLLTAPPHVLRELVISNTILSMFCQKSLPVSIARWLLTILLMSDDKMLSQAAFSVLTCLFHQTQMYSLSAEPFYITYSDVVKIIQQFGASVNVNGDIQSTPPSPSDFKLEHKDKELLINNLNNFIKYLCLLLTTSPQISPLLCPEKLIVLLLRVTLDCHIMDSILDVTVVQCISAALSCYSKEEWNSTKIEQLCKSFLMVTDNHHNWCRMVTNIGNITTRSRQLQKEFARMVIKVRTPAMVVPDGTGDFDFMVAFIKTLCEQTEERDLFLLYCLMDVLSMFISPLELSKEKDSELSGLIDYLSVLSSRIQDNPNAPITGFVKDSILRLRNVLQCVPGQQLQQRSILSYVTEM